MNTLKIYKIQQHGKSRQYRHGVEWVLETTSDPRWEYGGSLGSLPWKNKTKLARKLLALSLNHVVL
jgi:hypothetical protein